MSACLIVDFSGFLIKTWPCGEAEMQAARQRCVWVRFCLAFWHNTGEDQLRIHFLRFDSQLPWSSSFNTQRARLMHWGGLGLE